MKKLMMSTLALGLVSAIAGCAVPSDAQDSQDDATESTATADLTVTPRYKANTFNWVRVCSGLALRSCDNPGGCDTGVRLAAHAKVFSDFEDTGTGLAHLTAPAGWAAVRSPSGLLALESVDGPCN